MHNIYNLNGLPFWTEKEIRLREWMTEYYARELREALLGINPAWKFFHIEAPLLTPRALVNPNYSHEDIFAQESVGDPEVPENQLALRPETTPGSYAYAAFAMTNRLAQPPFVVWQAGKSFRRENDQVTKNMRLKEFYQQEFQCLFTSDTKNDYQAAIIPHVQQMLSDTIGLPTRIVDSDRLPSYSKRTVDVEVDNGDKWMEVCSISLRTDFPAKVKFTVKKNGVPNDVVERDVLVCEIAIGTDRCVYNFFQRTETKTCPT